MAFNPNEQNQKKSPRYRDPNVIEFNLLKATPCEAWFDIAVDEFKEECIKFLNKQIGGVTDFKYEVNESTGQVAWYAFFDKNSEHFYDKSTVNSGLGKSIKRTSDKFRNFLKEYGWNRRDENPYINESQEEIEKRSKVDVKNITVYSKYSVGYRIAITKILLILFDARGEEYKRRYSEKPSRVRVYRQHLFNWNYGKNKKAKREDLLTQPEWVAKCATERRYKAFPREIFGIRVCKKYNDESGLTSGDPIISMN